MSTMNVHDIAGELMQQATSGGGSGRAARTLYGGHEKTLRQTIIALMANHELKEHESPGEATLLVLEGEIRIGAGADSIEGRKGDLIPIPPVRHNLAAITDAVVILSVALR
jgi:quercetin dioxygenase-like cupin family protein